jgi:hypothetical protein
MSLGVTIFATGAGLLGMSLNSIILATGAELLGISLSLIICAVGARELGLSTSGADLLRSEMCSLFVADIMGDWWSACPARVGKAALGSVRGRAAWAALLSLILV